jgi:hypothetical protein
MNALVETIFYDNKLTEATTDFATRYKYRFRSNAAALFSSDTLSSSIRMPSAAKAKPAISVTKSAGGC